MPRVPKIEDYMKAHDEALNEHFGEKKWHCDDLYDAKALPDCVMAFLRVARAPAVEKWQMEQPPLYADFKRKRVRVTMASRLGDVGITEHLNCDHGYSDRVYLPELFNFGAEP